jgi:hypothetical protein
MLLGKARAHGAVEGLAVRSHAILIPRRASTVRVWAGTTVGPRSTTGGLECSECVGLGWCCGFVCIGGHELDVGR